MRRMLQRSRNEERTRKMKNPQLVVAEAPLSLWLETSFHMLRRNSNRRNKSKKNEPKTLETD